MAGFYLFCRVKELDEKAECRRKDREKLDSYLAFMQQKM
jgi:hypothetical protein